MTTSSTHSLAHEPLTAVPSLIERQFPVAKLSMESYKERRAGFGQTLTGLGRWWGRKPLVLVRAALLGLLIPADDDPERDREIFLKLMTMDREGLVRRKTKAIPGQRLVEELISLTPGLQHRFLDPNAPPSKPRLRRLSCADRAELQLLVFDRLSYGQKLEYCDRPEQIDGPSEEAWVDINAHLGTSASSLPELVEELGQRRFGQRPSVGDPFCGGGSIPFEAARLGCDAYGSDLNPVAALLTWAALNVVGGGPEVEEAVRETQRRVYDAVDHQITEWGIEHNSLGWRADAYLYCVEVTDPESGWRIPLAPSWVIGEGTKTIARLVPDPANKRYDIEIHTGVSEAEVEGARQGGTIKDSRLVPPGGGPSTPIDVLRRNLRMWENDDLVPRPDDVFGERLYCIRWVETFTDDHGRTHTRRRYRAPTADDIKREQRALELLHERFREWQEKGYIPSRPIEPGYNTDQPIRERGWTYWHHLFTPRQLLIAGLFLKLFLSSPNTAPRVAGLLSCARIVDFNSRLSRWVPAMGQEKTVNALGNQALNTMYNFGSRGFSDLLLASDLRVTSERVQAGLVSARDARAVDTHCTIWISDPPYADAVNYEQVSEFYLSWYGPHLPALFPGWYSDSKRALTVKGGDQVFRRSMVDCYRRLTQCMPDNGLQIVMFTHQDAAVWADLSMILWAAGLRVTAAWTVATETNTAQKQGNYVQGTVLLVLRKRTVVDPVFLDEIAHAVEAEVRRQLDLMIALEDDSDPNFGDADYQLAAYAAALRVLTAQPIAEIDPAREILRERPQGEVGPVEQLIRNAVKIACDHLVPRGFPADLWKRLSPMERFYLKGVEVESHGERRVGVYQELARGFGATQYTDLLASTQANETRLKTATDLGRRMLAGDGFGRSLVRHCLFAVHLIVQNDEMRDGLNWLHTELADYWGDRERIVQILGYLAALQHVSSMEAWRKDGHAAQLLAGAVRNDHI